MRRNQVVYSAASLGVLAMAGGGMGFARREPAPEKYPGQRDAFRRGAWVGDGIPPDPKRSKGRKCRQA